MTIDDEQKQRIVLEINDFAYFFVSTDSSLQRIERSQHEYGGRRSTHCPF